MDHQEVFGALEAVCEDIISTMCAPSDTPYGAVAKRLVACMKEVQEHGRVLEPVVAGFVSIFHHYDFDAETPGNGYRTLVKVGARTQRCGDGDRHVGTGTSVPAGHVLSLTSGPRPQQRSAWT